MHKIVLKMLISVTVVTSLLFPAGALAGPDPVVIGVPSSLNMLEASEGLKAIKMAVEEINAKGGVRVGDQMRPFKVEAIDTRGGEPGVPIADALLSIEKLFLEKKPHAVVLGPFRSEVLLAAMDLYAKYEMVSLNVAMTPKFVSKYKGDPEKYKYCFRMLDARHVVGYLMKVMSKLSADYGFKKVYIINQDVLWANAIGSGMKKWLEKNNFEVTGHDAYPTGATDFSTSLIKAGKSGSQIILPIFDMSSSGILVLQWRDMRIPALPVGFISPLMGSEAGNTFGDAINGVVNIIFQGGNIPLAKYAPATNFFAAYEKRWGKALQSGHMPSEAYDSVYVLAKAIEKAGSLDKDKLIAALEATDHKGSIGRIRMKDHQYVFGEDPAENAILVVYQWKKGGKRVPVFPESIAEGPIDKPEWMK